MISLAGGGRIVLDGVQASSLTGAHIVYSAAAYQATPAASVPRRSMDQGRSSSADLKIYAGETVHEQASPYGFVNQGYSFDNFGKVSVSYPVAALSDTVIGWIDSTTTAQGDIFLTRSFTIINEAGATFSVSDPEGGAVGFVAFSGMPNTGIDEAFTNAGLINVSAAGKAIGFEGYGGGNFINTISGDVSVATKGAAYGFHLVNGGTIENDGTIAITGGSTAYGMYSDRAEGKSFTNKGTLTVTADATGHSYGIDVGGLNRTGVWQPLLHGGQYRNHHRPNGHHGI